MLHQAETVSAKEVIKPHRSRFEQSVLDQWPYRRGMLGGADRYLSQWPTSDNGLNCHNGSAIRGVMA